MFPESFPYIFFVLPDNFPLTIYPFKISQSRIQTTGLSSGDFPEFFMLPLPWSKKRQPAGSTRSPFVDFPPTTGPGGLALPLFQVLGRDGLLGVFRVEGQGAGGVVQPSSSECIPHFPPVFDFKSSSAFQSSPSCRASVQQMFWKRHVKAVPIFVSTSSSVALLGSYFGPFSPSRPLPSPTPTFLFLLSFTSRVRRATAFLCSKDWYRTVGLHFLPEYPFRRVCKFALPALQPK